MLPRNIYWGIKAAGLYACCLEIWEYKIPGNPRTCPGLYRDYFTFFYVKCGSHMKRTE